jgi:hypothetical protein
VYNLTTNQYDQLRNLVRRSPVFIGKRIVVHDDWVDVVDEELEFGLAMVFDAVGNAPADQWPSLVDDRLQRIYDVLTGREDPQLSGPTEQLLPRVYVKLRPVEGTMTERLTYAREVAPDLLLTLALDSPDFISILNDDQVGRHGFDQLLDAGMENLAGQLPDEAAGRGDVLIITGAEYTASTAVILPWVVEAYTGTADFPHGVLVAVPNDNMLLFHVLKDGAGARHALTDMAQLADECYEDSPRPLSRSVFWWNFGIGYFHPVAHYTGDNGVIGGSNVTTHYPPEFAEVLDDLDR